MKSILITLSLLTLAWSDVLTTHWRVAQVPAARAFTITRRLYVKRDNEVVTEEGTEVEYRDSEGNVRREQRSLNELATGGLVITGKDNDVGWYSVGQGQQLGLYVKTCPEPSTPAQSFEQLRAQSDFAREEKAFGFRVAVLRPVYYVADFHEIWLAPELDGVEIKRITHWPDGRYYYISEATSITLGEPSDGRARLPRGLKERRDVCKEKLSFPTPIPIRQLTRADQGLH